jgi:hypothetical protein
VVLILCFLDVAALRLQNILLKRVFGLAFLSFLEVCLIKTALLTSLDFGGLVSFLVVGHQ